MDSWLQLAESVLPFDLAGRLLLAVAAGALLGWERELRDKPAGLRTHMMVSLGAAAFMAVTVEFADSFGAGNPSIRLDPSRTVAGIIGGVGFLGAGTIIEARGHVRGITTAASIWVAAALGTACGLGMYHVAFTSALIALAVLWLVGLLEKPGRMSRSSSAAADDNEGQTNT